MLIIDLTAHIGAFELTFAASVPTSLGIDGPSGAGKTSLLHLVAGIRTPDRGRIEVPDRVWFDEATCVPAAARRVGLVFQDARLFPHLDVRANLRFGARDGPVAFDAVVDGLGLGALLQARPARLSGGEKRRVALGRALLSQPHVLLLDEPFTGLDDALRERAIRLVAEARRLLGAPMIVVSHEMDVLVQLTDRIVTLQAGRVIEPKCPAVNVVLGESDGATVRVGDSTLTLAAPPGPARVLFRPEDVVLAAPGARVGLSHRLSAQVVAQHDGVVELRQSSAEGDQTLFARCATLIAGPGEPIDCWLAASAVRVIGEAPTHHAKSGSTPSPTRSAK